MKVERTEKVVVALMVVLASCASAWAVDGNEPIAHWTFDEGTGTTVYDSVGTKDGTVYGAQWTTGRVGGALSFDGIDDYVGLPDNNPVWLPQNNFTLSVWVYFERDADAGYSLEQILDLNFAASGDPDNELGYTIARDEAAGGRLGFAMTTTTNSNEDLGSQEVLVKNKWYHLVAVRDDTTQAIYIDGEPNVGRTCSPDPIDFVGGYDDDKVNIGKFSRFGVSSAYELKGIIDEVRIYDRALSAGEIQQLYTVVGPVWIELSATQLEFSADLGGPNPAPQVLTVRNSGPGSLNWQISEDCDWLAVEPNSGSSTGEANEVTLSVDVAGMAWGSYDCNLMVSDPCAMNSPQTVEVNLRIYGPLIAVSVTEFTFFASELAPEPNDQILGIRNRGVGTLEWTISYECNWLQAEPNSGSSTGEADEVSLSIDTTGMSEGDYYSCELTISDANAENSPQIVEVELLFGAGDLEPDGDVDVDDISILASAWKTKPGDAKWNPVCDISDPKDDFINEPDLAILCKYWLYGKAFDPGWHLVGYWKFDEGEGPTAYDSAGSNDGTLMGDPNWTAGQISGALDFDGNDAVYLGPSAGTDSALNIYNTDLTISAWVKIRGTGGTIVARAANPHWAYTLGVSTNKAYIRTNKWGYWTLYTGEILNPDTWYHIVGVFDRSWDRGRVYVNGFEEAEGLMTDDPLSNDAATKIGCRNDTSDLAFDGIIDDVRIYDRALYADEIWQLYRRGLYWGLAGYWKFDESEGTKARDSAQNRHGTVYEAQWTTGQIDGALSFDGIDDYVALQDNNPVWLPQNNFTLCAWLYFEREAGSSMEYILDLNHADSVDPSYELGYAVIRNPAAGRVVFCMTTTSDSDEDLVSDDILADNQWYHVVAVRDGTTQAIYINGQPNGSRTCTSDPIDFAGGYDDDKVNIGKMSRQGVTGSSHLEGTVDDVRFYNRALSAGEIQQLYEEGL